MNIPKVIFKVLSLEENIEIVKWSFNSKEENLDMKGYTLELFPGINNDNLEDIVSKYYKDNIDDIINNVERYNSIWNKYNDIYISTLLDYFNINNDINLIEAKVGIIPIFPRNIDNNSFCLSINLDENKLIEVVAHETLHFYWFKKFKELYPNISNEKYNFPFIEWKYSEMVTDPILNNSPFKEIFSFTEKGYDIFYEKYNNIMDFLRNLYSLNKNIDDKIKEGFDYIKINMI